MLNFIKRYFRNRADHKFVTPNCIIENNYALKVTAFIKVQSNFKEFIDLVFSTDLVYNFETFKIDNYLIDYYIGNNEILNFRLFYSNFSIIEVGVDIKSGLLYSMSCSESGIGFINVIVKFLELETIRINNFGVKFSNNICENLLKQIDKEIYELEEKTIPF